MSVKICQKRENKRKLKITRYIRKNYVPENEKQMVNESDKRRKRDVRENIPEDEKQKEAANKKMRMKNLCESENMPEDEKQKVNESDKRKKKRCPPVTKRKTSPYLFTSSKSKQG